MESFSSLRDAMPTIEPAKTSLETVSSESTQWKTRPSVNNPKIPNQIELPIPRHTPTTKGRYWIFGIAVPESQLLEYYDGPTYRHRFGKKWDINENKISKLLSVCYLLKYLVRIEEICLDLCFPKGMGPTPEDPYGIQRYEVVVTICTSNRYSYLHRPSKEPVEKLQTILGCGPAEWYLDTKSTDYH